MRKYLLFVLLCFCFLQPKAQVLNEILSQPANCNDNGGGTEFFEIYGNAATNLDCYAMVSFFETGTEKGFYVIDLPAVNKMPDATGRWWYVGSSMLTFCTGGKDLPSANLDWNAAGVKKYTWNGSSYNTPVTLTNLDDFFSISSGLFKENAMLFAVQPGQTKATLVNGVFGNISGSTTFPLSGRLGTGMPADIPGAIFCGGTPADITFQALSSNSVEYVTAASGNGNGYFRGADGQCGTWKKAASPSDHTPGSFAPDGQISSTAYSITPSLPQCPNKDGNTTSNFVATATFVYPPTLNPYTIQYTMIKDDGDGVIESSDALLYTTQITQAQAPNNQVSISFTGATQGDRYFMQAKSIQGCYFASTSFVIPTCVPLPVKLKSFNAKRHKDKVDLSWETVMELNNSGFDVQRKIGNEEWKTIAFVFSQANAGNSNALLTYEYTDINPTKGITQYRLRQVDIDTRYTISEVRSVRGESQAAQLLIYPNPSMDGKVNIVFEDRNIVRTIAISDMSGRVVKQYRNISASSLQIDGLQDGVYTVHITDGNTAVTTVEKIIIKKR
jgi:hypothetical protein